MVGRRDGLRSTQAASGRSPTLHRSLSRWRPIATRRHPRPCPHSLTRTSCCTRQAPLTTSAEDIDRTSPARSGRPRPFRPSAAGFYTQATRHSREEPLPHDTAVALIKSWRGRFGDTREFASDNRAGVLPTHRGAKVLIVTANAKVPESTSRQPTPVRSRETEHPLPTLLSHALVAATIAAFLPSTR